MATIIEVRGSVPREVGAKMIIHPLGKHVGTVAAAAEKGTSSGTALDVIQTGEAATVHVDLTEDVSMQALGVCGGKMDVFVERARPAGPFRATRSRPSWPLQASTAASASP